MKISMKIIYLLMAKSIEMKMKENSNEILKAENQSMANEEYENGNGEEEKEMKKAKPAGVIENIPGGIIGVKASEENQSMISWPAEKLSRSVS
jgi:hypothetical protein